MSKVHAISRPRKYTIETQSNGAQTFYIRHDSQTTFRIYHKTYHDAIKRTLNRVFHIHKSANYNEWVLE